VAASAARGADWPTYRGDNARSGVTREKLALPLSPAWVFQPRHAPEPAWGDPNPRKVGGFYGSIEGRRNHHDDVFHVAVAGGALFFGSSSDNKVYCLDAATGRERWSFFTGGPVRLAPTVAEGKVYFGSDDGWVYCLQAADGSEVWKLRAAPSDRKVLGSGKMVSLWPVRTGVLVDEGVAYFGAGIFPAEGVYLYAVNAEDGKAIWCNDRGGADPQSRISPQGYLLASKTTLFVPLGRVSPAAFDRATGKLLGQPTFGHEIGGTYAQLVDDMVVTGTEMLLAYDQKTPGKRLAWFRGRQVAFARDAAYMANDAELVALDRATYPKISLAVQGIMNQRERMAEPLSLARGNLRKLETAVKEDDETLKVLDKEIAELAAKGEAAAADLARLQGHREEADAALTKDTKALDGAKKHLARMEDQAKALAEKLKKAEAEVSTAVLWRAQAECPEALVLADGAVFAGGKGKVVGIDTATGKEGWSAQVEGTAKGLAVADGSLFVSTDTGAIYCFGRPPKGRTTNEPEVVKQPIEAAPFPKDGLTPAYEAAAERIVSATGVTKGFCLLLGNDTGRLAAELARRTELRIVAVCGSGEANAAAARKALDATGLYGSRVTIEHVKPPLVPYSDYFANLVVSEGAFTKGMLPFDAKDVLRTLRPLGGKLFIGAPAEAKDKLKPPSEEALRSWADSAPLEGAKVTAEGGLWLAFTRGPLAGAGSWTHEYAEPGNTTCGDDQLVRCPLGVLWFGEPGPGKMQERHVRVAAPLAVNGRFFAQGVGTLMAYDAYNGLKLWEKAVPGIDRIVVSAEASNMAANADSIFVAVGDKCFRFDAATGEVKTTYALPPTEAKDPKKRSWGYLAVVGDTVFGSRSAVARSAEALFALDVPSGALRWSHKGVSIPHSSISIGDGQVMFVDNPSAEQRKEVLKEKLAEFEKLTGADRLKAEKELKAASVRLIVVLDAATGKPVWEKALDMTGCGGGAYYSALGSIYAKGVLLLFGVYSDGHYWREFFAGQFNQRRVLALDAKTGAELWTQKIGYRVRPLVIGDTLHAEPWTYGLRTGVQKKRVNPLTGAEEPWQWGRPGHHCGTPAASEHTLFFRSNTLGWYDLVGDYGTQHFGAQRPGCWINFIPACGLMIFPEASSGCMCPYPNTCTVVFQHREGQRVSGFYSAAGPIAPAKRLAINLGGSGDRKDPSGALWLGYPRPAGSLVLRLSVGVNMLPGGEYFDRDPALVQVEGTDKPWLFLTGVRGLGSCTLPVTDAGDGAGRYTVRLAFADIEQGEPGTRVFDIKLQGQLAEKGFDVVKEAGGRNKAVVREFKGIEAKDKLRIDLVPAVSKPTKEQLPILQGVEVVREEVLSVGLLAPTLLLSDAATEQEREVRIANHKSAPFAGTLRAEAPDGFSVTLADTPLKLAPGEIVKTTLKAAVDKPGKRAKHPFTLKLLRENGDIECQEQGTIDYLGAMGRIVLKAAEDTYVDKGFPIGTFGSAKSMLVDGGDALMGDQSHQVAFLKFRIQVPGNPAAVVLRLYNAGNPGGDGGNVCQVSDPWSEKELAYEKLPRLGRPIARIGPVASEQAVEVPLKLSLKGLKELSLAIDPVNLDGVDFFTREGGKPAELVVDYEKEP